ncbi:MAG: family 78 glycoside hydrolase catalytic domain [Oscillospiraceae bacterium]|nr:family 78 glycoside hydrolase catalytic domain [Oscillospiraceae bacterium]
MRDIIGVKGRAFMIKNASWIKAPIDTDAAVVKFHRDFCCEKHVKKCVVQVSAIGIFYAYINGKRIGNDVFAPGWTSYGKRVQYREYDITDFLCDDNTVEIELGRGWAVGSVGLTNPYPYQTKQALVIANLHITYTDGAEDYLFTDDTWDVYTSKVTFSEMYHGETVDMTASEKLLGKAKVSDFETKLIPTVGELIVEHERLSPCGLIHTPEGEVVLDFGQNLTGYVEIKIRGDRGGKIVVHYAEVLDSDGNFYTDNMRSARNENVYILSGENDVFKPRFCFQGFRYVRLAEYPFEEIDPGCFSAIAVYSNMKRTGDFSCGNEKINQLYRNILWGQKSNFLDVPTDCPQRDERLGWTGDAQVFAPTAMINYDVKRFFTKWLGDMAEEQRDDGAIGDIVPNCRRNLEDIHPATGWSDAACIIPWELYLAYGDKALLREHYPMMKNWVEYMRKESGCKYLWTSGEHYGDWLALDGNPDEYKGLTPTHFIASAFFAHSTSILIKAGKVLGEEVSEYEKLYEKIISAFRAEYLKDGKLHLVSDNRKNGDDEPILETQTAYVLALRFGLCEEKDRAYFAKRLVELIAENGGCNTCGFLGTPHILHALSENGYTDVAYRLLLREESPSWLYPINHGATTMWEHWNGIKEDGSFWSADMNSFNHYAYGAVFDWIFGVAVGIKPIKPGYKEVGIVPHPLEEIGFAEGRIKTSYGEIGVKWYYENAYVCYDIELPEGVTARLDLPGEDALTLGSGRHRFVR